MARIIGVEIPDKKPVWIGLTRIYGVGRTNVAQILKEAKVPQDKKVGQLESEEITRITKALEKIKTEGDLRQAVAEDIKRLKMAGSYRGSRHEKGLPARGQRTRTNARTKRGKRVTIGAMKRKDALVKGQQKEEETGKEG